MIEKLAFEARNYEYVDSKSGVSARLTTSAYEYMISSAERRMYLNDEENTVVRVSDFLSVVPAVNGKLELVNHLGIELGSSVEEILKNLEDVNFNKENIFVTKIIQIKG